jgi:hypothetical protein
VAEGVGSPTAYSNKLEFNSVEAGVDKLGVELFEETKYGNILSLKTTCLATYIRSVGL